VATRVSAIPELVDDGVTGVLADAGDAQALAGAIGRLIRDPQARHRLGSAGRQRVARDFRFDRGIERLRAKFAQSIGPADS
jgi:glycosyltransferase involved in cell wall biosynthesis